MRMTSGARYQRVTTCFVSFFAILIGGFSLGTSDTYGIDVIDWVISFSNKLIDLIIFLEGLVLLPSACCCALGNESKTSILRSSGRVLLPCISSAFLQEFDSSIRIVGFELLFLVERLPLPSVSVISLIVLSVLDLLPLPELRL